MIWSSIASLSSVNALLSRTTEIAELSTDVGAIEQRHLLISLLDLSRVSG